MDVFLVILAIGAALLGFFKDKSDTDSGKKKRKLNQPQPSSAPSGGRDPSGGMVSGNQGQGEVSSASIEDHQQEQRKRLAERMNTATQVEMEKRKHDAVIGGKKKASEEHLSFEQKQLKKRIKKNLNQKGLVNGIIMSEVLGSPRAKRPYQSVVARRKN